LSIDEATPKDWDDTLKKLKEDRFYDNREIPKQDNVNRPQHYTTSEIECIDYIQMQLGSGVKDYLRGQIYKYMHRHQLKGAEVEDLRKARWYIDKLIYELVQEGL
jgi:hypothetical protein